MLTVSRPDIISTDLQEFPAATRFVKLPIRPYLELLTINHSTVWSEINAPQIALINAINSPQYRFICAALSRRLGKTFIANIMGQLVTLMPNSNVLIMSPNFSLSSISFELQRRFIKHFDLEVSKDNLKDKVIELANGSTIRMGSISTVDSCVGRSYDLIIFDEAALGTDAESAFNISLRPTLDKPNSKAVFISTPRGKNNWFSRFYNRGFDPNYPQWISLHADYLENKRMQASDVEEAKRSMTKAHFEQEYMASFSSFEGQIYDFKPEWITKAPSTGETIAGLDPGYRDPTAFIVIRYAEGLFWVVDEYLASEAVTSAHASKISELVTKYNIDSIFIDSAAAQFAADLAYSYDIASIKAKKDILPGIAHTQTIIETGRLRVEEHCTHTLQMLDQYRWDPSGDLPKEKPLHDQYSHMADALRYALYSWVL